MSEALLDISFLLREMHRGGVGELGEEGNLPERAVVCAVAMKELGHEIALHWCDTVTIDENGRQRKRAVWAMELPDENWVGLHLPPPIPDVELNITVGLGNIEAAAEQAAAAIANGVVFEWGKWETVSDIMDQAMMLDTINSTSSHPRPPIDDLVQQAVSCVRAYRLNEGTCQAKMTKSSSPRL